MKCFIEVYCPETLILLLENNKLHYELEKDDKIVNPENVKVNTNQMVSPTHPLWYRCNIIQEVYESLLVPITISELQT